MANFSTLFPNLQGNLDFYDQDPSAASGTGGSNQIYNWAQASNPSETIPVDKIPTIPISKLPTLELSHTFVFDNTNGGSGDDLTAQTEAQALASFITAFDTGTTGAGLRTNDVGRSLNSGDIIVIQYVKTAASADNAGDEEDDTTEWIYAGDTVAAGGTPVASDFVDITTAAGTTVLAGTNISITGGDTVNLADNVDIAGTLDVTGAATFDSNVTLGAFGITEAAATLVSFSANATSFNVNANGTSTIASNALNLNAQSYDGNTTGSNIALSSNFSIGSATAGSGSISAGTSGLDISSTSTATDAIDIASTTGGVTIEGTSITASTSGNGNLSLSAAGTGEVRVSGNGVTAGTGDGVGAAQILAVGVDGALKTIGTGTPPGAYAYTASTDTTAFSGPLNTVIYVPAQSAQQVITLADSTAPANGTWVKIVNNSGRSDLRINTTQGIVGTGDTFLVLNDTSANIELIYTAGGWAIIAS